MITSMPEAEEQVEEVLREAWTDIEVRIIGALVEKQVTTPDGYPLSMNALRNACNQKSSRDPVMELDERSLDDAIYNLRQRNLLIVTNSAGGHVPKYKHDLPGYFGLEQHEVAVLCVLMLRGPQTPGEIRGRTGRMHSFGSVGEVVSTIDELMHRIDPPIIAKLPRETGRKEQRYAHLLCGESAVQHAAPSVVAAPPVDRQAPSSAPPAALDDLKEEVASLRQELNAFKEQFAEFRKQFD